MADIIRTVNVLSSSISHRERLSSPKRESSAFSNSVNNDDLNTLNDFAAASINNNDDLVDFDDIDNNQAMDLASYAPPETQWYHGRLDRHAAEDRLKSSNRTNGYLIRESDRKPGSYVLSHFGKTGVNHFRITSVCGDFYIGGRRFNSLLDLIGYYTQFSDLLKRERLVTPIPPPEPVNDKKRLVAVLPYTKMPDTEELSFKKGDIFFCHNDMGDGWLWVTAHRTGDQGLIFRELVEDLDESIDPNTVFSWFHANCTKQEAVDRLVKAGPGSFLVRPSDNSPGDYSLFFHVNNQIQRFRIEKKGVRYLMGGRTFECLDAVINRYRKEQIVEGHTLQFPLVTGGGGGGGGDSFSQTDGNFGTGTISYPTANKNNTVVSQTSSQTAAAEKIYATLRECRDQAGLKKTRGIKLSGYLAKKSEKLGKKWKSYYFVLQVDACDTHLYVYENPKRTKPKTLIDLSCAYLYQVDESLWERPFCFQIVERQLPCLASTNHLSASNEDDFYEWINVLRPLCVSQSRRFLSKVPGLRELRSLSLSILDAHGQPPKLVPQPYCVVEFNGQLKVAKTKIHSGTESNWNEDFVFDDIPTDVVSVSLKLHNKSKRSKNSEVAEVVIDLDVLENGEERDDWYPFAGITPMGDWGFIRLKTRFIHDIIMPNDEYNSFQQLILQPGLSIVHTLADLCHSDRNPLANALLNVFRAEKRETELLIELNNVEIELETETSTLFRAASLPTTLMDIYMKSECGLFLKVALSDLIQKLTESKQSAELNPTKMDSIEDACNNAEFLLQILDQVTLSIFSAADSFPPSIRYVFNCLQKTVMAKWPNERFVRTRVISGFLFLRLLCPALLNPRQFGLVTETPSQNVSRSLIMVAKCLQNLANLVEFGGKEPYMEVVNPFILKNKERMVVFLDQLSNVHTYNAAVDFPAFLFGGGGGGGGGGGSTNATATTTVTQPTIDTGRDLAILFHICVSFLSEFCHLSDTQPAIKTLVTVVQMLSSHKKRYLEMIN